MGLEKFPLLPNEVVHDILLFFAQSSIESAKTLSFVASWARTIALPYVLPVLILDEQWPANDIEKPLDSSPFHHTKHIMFSEGRRDGQAKIFESMLSLFPKANHLAMTDASFFALALQYKGQQRDWNITILPYAHDPRTRSHLAFTSRTPSLRLFKNVTRLRVNMPSLVWQDQPAVQLARFIQFRRLTHLAVGLTVGDYSWVTQLIECMLAPEQLQMVVLCTEKHQHQAGWFRDTPTRLLDDLIRETRSRDSRFYALREDQGRLELERVRLDWISESRGGESVWDMAQRRAAES